MIDLDGYMDACLDGVRMMRRMKVMVLMMRMVMASALLGDPS